MSVCLAKVVFRFLVICAWTLYCFCLGVVALESQVLVLPVRLFAGLSGFRVYSGFGAWAFCMVGL